MRMQKNKNNFSGQSFCFSVTLPGYYIVENNVPRKVTREEYEKRAAKNECCFLALGENKTEENG